MNTPFVAKAAGRTTIRTVVVRLSRKLKAVYRLRSGPQFSQLLLAMVAVLSPMAARALPQGLQVQSGQVTQTSPSASSMVLNQGTPKAILDWQSFSIGAGQSVRFVQPGATSVALNRVVGSDASSIFGSLTANGQVFLVNPAGVLFAPGAQVNVGGLVASTLSLSNTDFLAGRYQFTGTGGSVVNQGSLKGGYVVLASNNVSNAGAINAPSGSVGLLAGSRVTVDPAGAGLVRFSVDAAAVDAAVSNSGTIRADGGQVAILASALSDTLPTVINQTGIIRADSISNQNGTIVLGGGDHGIVNVSGTLQARGLQAGETGGTIKLLGDRVGVHSGAVVSASGNAGGGTVLVGGNYQGQGPEQNSHVTVVARGATLDASATASGNGGKLVVWSDGNTYFAGTGKVRGGAAGGDGGVAEVSGKQSLTYLGTVQAQGGRGGKMGSLLLDPEHIEVVDNPALADVNGDGTTGDDLATATLNATTADGLTSVISNDAVVAQLDAANVTLNALSNITVSAAIDATGNANANRLTLRSTGAGTIAINAPITLKAGSSGFVATTTGAGTINVGAAIDSGGGSLLLTTGGGVVNIGADLNAGASSMSVTGSTRIAGARSLTAVTTTFNGAVDGDGAAGADTLSLSGRSVFTAAVGASDPLGSLQVGGTSSLAGNVTTIGAQTFTGASKLTGDVTLQSTGNANVTFGAGVTGTTAGTEALVVNTGGTTSFGGAIGSVAVPLESLSTAGPTVLGGSVRTADGQTYGGNVTLTADVTANSANNAGIAFNGTVDGTTAGTESLTVNTTGATTFASTVGGGTALQFLTTNAGGTTSLGGNVTTAAAQTYNDNVVLTASVTSASTGGSAIAFNGTVDGTTSGTQALTVDTTSTTTFGSTVGAGTSLLSLATNAGGTTRLGGNVTTAATQSYGDNVVLTADATLAGTTVGFGGTVNGTTAGAESLTVTGGASFAGAVGNSRALEFLNTSGTTSLGGNVTTADAQTYGGNVTLTGDVTSSSTNNAGISFGGTVNGTTAGTEALAVNTTGNTTFASTVGAGTSLQSLTTNAGGTTFLGGNVTTAAGQTYNDNVVLTASVTSASTGGSSIAFNGTVDGNTSGTRALVVNTAGTTTFGSTVGTGTALLSVATDAGGTTRLGGNVTTATTQNYGDNVTLTVDTTLAGTTVSFGGTVNGTTAGNESLTVTGAAAFAGAVGNSRALEFLNTSGTTSLGGNVTTADAQTYGGNVVLTGDVTSSSTNNAAIGFGGTVNGTTAGTEALTVNTAGNTTFASTVGAGTALQSLTTNAGGTTFLGGNVTTGGAQTYNDNVVLNASVTGASTGAGNIAFNGTVDGNTAGTRALVVNTAGTTTFGSTVGAGTALLSVATNAGGTTRLGGNVTTTSTQNYGDNAVLTADVTLAGTAVGFGGTLNGTTAGAESLAVTAPAATFAGAVGNSRALEFLTTSGTASLGGNVTTAGVQTYAGNVTLTGDVVSSSTGNAAIGFGGTVNGTTAGGEALTVNTTGNTTFASTIGAGTALQSLTTNAGGTTALNGNVTTVGAQTYNDSVVLGVDLTAASTGSGNIAFNGTVNGTVAGAQSLTVNTAGTTTFGSTVGAGTSLEFVTTDAPGATRIGGNVTTATTQSYADAVTLTADATLTGTAVALGGTVNGNGTGTESLTVNAGTATFGSSVGAARSLEFLATSGATSLGGNVTTAGLQSYGGNVSLTGNVTSTSTGNGAVTFAGTVNGAQALAVNTGGATTFASTVGAGTALQSLSTGGGGTTSLGGNVTTSGGQTYGDNVVLATSIASVSTGGGDIAFNGTVNGTVAGAQSLTVNTAGTTSFGPGVGTGTALQTLATDAGGTTRLGGNVTTTGAQSYGDAVVLAGDVVATAGGNVSFASTVNAAMAGADGLTVTTPGSTVFSGAVGTGAALQFLTTNGGGTTSLGGSVTTTGAQTYADAVTLAGSAALTGSAITASAGINGGGNNLTLMPVGSANVSNGSNINTLTFAGGSLDGNYTAGTYQLNGGTVNATLGAGTLQVAQGTTTLNGTAAAGTVNVASGRLNLGPTTNRLTGATTVTVQSGGTLDTGSAAQTFGSAGSPAGVSNSGTLIVGRSLTAGSLGGGGRLQTAAGSSLTTTGALAATTASNTIGDGTTVTAGGDLSLAGDFAGAVTVNGAAPSVTLNDLSAGTALNLTETTNSAGSVNVRSAGAMVASIDANAATRVDLTSGTAMTLNRLQVSPNAAVTLNAGNNLTVDSQFLSPVNTLFIGSANGNAQFNNSRQANGGAGVLATGGMTVNIPRGQLNTPADPMLIHPDTTSFIVQAALAVWIDSSLFTAVQNNVVGGTQSETDRFIRMMLRNDAGILPVENLVLLGNAPLDAVVAPLSFPSLQIKLPDCLAQQRNGEGQCPEPRR